MYRFLFWAFRCSTIQCHQNDALRLLPLSQQLWSVLRRANLAHLRGYDWVCRTVFQVRYLYFICGGCEFVDVGGFCDDIILLNVEERRFRSMKLRHIHEPTERVVRRDQRTRSNGHIQIREFRFKKQYNVTIKIHGIHVIHCFVKDFIFFLCTRPLRTGVPIVEDHYLRFRISLCELVCVREKHYY